MTSAAEGDPTISEMYLAVDAIERKVKLVSNTDDSKFCILQRLNEKQLATFGVEVDENDLNGDYYIHCDLCNRFYRSSCKMHPLFVVCDREVREESKLRALQTLPAFFEVKTSKIPNAGLGVFAKIDIPVGLVFGPYQGVLLNDPKKAGHHGYSWEIRIENKSSQFLDGSSPMYSNWMRYINSSRFEKEQNLIAFQYNGSVYYRVFRPIGESVELLGGLNNDIFK